MRDGPDELEELEGDGLEEFEGNERDGGGPKIGGVRHGRGTVGVLGGEMGVVFL